MAGSLPLRGHWGLGDLGVNTVDTRNAVCSLLQYPMEAKDGDQQIILDAYIISAEKNHVIFGCFYIALAQQANAVALVCLSLFEADHTALLIDCPLRAGRPLEQGLLTAVTIVRALFLPL